MEERPSAPRVATASTDGPVPRDTPAPRVESVVRPALPVSEADTSAPTPGLDPTERRVPEGRIAPVAPGETRAPAVEPVRPTAQRAPAFPLPPAAVAQLAAREAATGAQSEVRPQAVTDAPSRRQEAVGTPERTAPENAPAAPRPAPVRPAASRDRAASPAIRPQIRATPPLPDFPARGAVGEAKPQQVPPTIRVSIGRIELRSTPPAPVPAGPPRRRPALSLEEYMQQRSGHR